MTRVLLAIAVLAVGCRAPLREPAAATPYVDPRVRIELLSECRAIAPGQPFTVALSIRHAPGYHTYWRNPGTVGLPTSIEWQLPPGFTASAIRWPIPQLTRMAAYTVWGYEDDALLLVDVTPPAGLAPGRPVTLRAKVAWMACARTCNPGFCDLAITLPVASDARLDADLRARFDAVREQQPRTLSAWTIRAARTGDDFALKLTPGEGANSAVEDAYFFGHDRLVSSDRPQRFERRGGALVLTMRAETFTPDALGDAPRLRGVLVSQSGWLAGGRVRAMKVDVPLEVPP